MTRLAKDYPRRRHVEQKARQRTLRSFRCRVFGGLPASLYLATRG